MSNLQCILCCISTSDWINIAGIIIPSGIGAWIAIIVQNNLTINRYLKDYFINEIKEIRDLYKSFFDSVYKGQKSSIEIKDWLKIMTGRIENIDLFLHDNYNIKDNLIKQKHAEIQQKVTDFEEFNECYTKPKVEFSSTSKNEILKLHSELAKALTQRVIDINSAVLKRNK